jgi:hypothetical protein
MNGSAGTFGQRAWTRAVAIAVVAGVAWSASQAPPEFVWTASETVTDLPTEMGPGYTLFTLVSDADTDDSLTLFRMREGTTLEAFVAASQRIDQAFMEGGDVVAALNEGLALVDVITEVSAAAGDRRSVGAVLTEGSYVLEYTPEEGPSERVYHEFGVTGSGTGPAAPTADATVHLVDFAFAFPPNLPAGEQTWHVINSGQQLHHMGIFALAEGATLEDFVAFMEQMEESGPPEGDDEMLAEPVDYIGITSAGQESYHFLDLAAGQYVAVCFLPDHLGDATGAPHLVLGMMQVFRVGE